VGRQDLLGLAAGRCSLLLDLAVALELFLLSLAPRLDLLGAFLGGTADGVLESLGVDDTHRRGVALRFDTEVGQTADDLTVLEAHLLGELVDADRDAHALSLLTATQSGPLSRGS
jgi:hypothetical protein